MFERFRIKVALRTQFVRLRASANMPQYSNAEQLFFEPAFHVAPIMRRERMTADAAMVFMVTDVVAQMGEDGYLAEMRSDDPEGYAHLHVLYDAVVARASADRALAAAVIAPTPHATPFAGEPVPVLPSAAE